MYALAWMFSFQKSYKEFKISGDTGMRRYQVGLVDVAVITLNLTL